MIYSFLTPFCRLFERQLAAIKRTSCHTLGLMVIKLSTCCDRCPSVTSSVICVKVCSYDGATRRASPREGNGGFPDFRRQRENKLENKNLSKKRIRFLKRANNQIEILKIIYYLFSIFKKKRFFRIGACFC